jgi:hypothetical protein
MFYNKPGFYLANDQFEFGDHRIWVPKLGWENNAALCVLSEALCLIGLIDQAVSGTGSDEDLNLAVDAE